jgi:hypothetical protein
MRWLSLLLTGAILAASPRCALPSTTPAPQEGAPISKATCEADTDAATSEDKTHKQRQPYCDFITVDAAEYDVLSWRAFILRDILKETCVSNQFPFLARALV